MPHLEGPLLQAYLDGYCNDARIAEVESHIESCDECRQRLEDARRAATRASQLLGALEPGPVHAPPFEELQARAAARAAGGETTAAGGDEVDWDSMLGAANTERVVPFWRRPALAWAATVVMAFGLGWLSRNELGLPADLKAPAGPSFERLGDAAETPTAAPADADVAEVSTALPAGSNPTGLRTQVSAEPELQRNIAVTDELDDLQAAKRSVSSELAATPPPAPTAILEAANQRQAAASRAETDAASQLRLAEGRTSADMLARESGVTVTGESALVGFNEQEEVAKTFADEGTVGRFVVVDRSAAELWLGVAPRELPALTLLRVEVGPGVLFDNGIPGRPAVRLVYRASSGQEIALLQQYTGPLARRELAQVGQLEAGRDAGAGAARANRARAVEELRTDLPVAADRDAVVGGFLNLPATVREPDGRAAYKWLEDGYLLSISGAVDPDVLRGLADRIR